MAEALAALRGRPDAPEVALLDALEYVRCEALLPALADGDHSRAVAAARALEAQVAELPLPEAELNPRLRVEVLTLQVELLRTAAGLHHEIAARV